MKNPEIEQLKSSLRDELSKGEYHIDNVLESLQSHETWLSAEQSNELLHVKSQWENYQSKNRKNLFYRGEAEVAYGRILDSLLGLVSGLKVAAVKSTPDQKQEEPQGVKTILFLAANPEQSSFLRLDKEYRAITECLRKSRDRDKYELELRLATRPSDLTQAVLYHKPWIVHFAGHGGLSEEDGDGAGNRGLTWNENEKEEDKEAGIMLMDEDSDEPQFVSMEALGAYFSFFKDSLDLVFLNSCYSGVQANAIVEHIPHVVGMRTAVSDSLAISFSEAFYQALFSGEEISRSFHLAKASLGITAEEGREIPQILSQS